MNRRNRRWPRQVRTHDGLSIESLQSSGQVRMTSHLKFLLPITLLLFSLADGQAQIPDNISARGINLPYFERTQLKAHFLATTAKPVPGGYAFATDFQMFTFGAGGESDVEVILKAPECYFDAETRRAWSAGSLLAFNSSTNYVIEGEGFVFQRTREGATLNISNKVHTIIQRENPATGKLEPPIHIYSDRLQFVSIEAEGPDHRIAHYTQNVRVEDPDMDLTSGSLRVAVPPGTNQVRRIVAREDVKIRSKADGSEAMGDFAAYVSTPEEETLMLSGNPVWRDAQNEGRAKQFIFDRKQKIVYGYTNAQLKLPRTAMASPDLVQPDAAAGPANTNAPVQLTAEFFEIALPATNRPSRSLIAKTNVVIFSPADKTTATSAVATFDDASGILDLQGNAVWQSDQTVARANRITVNRTNQTFRATGGNASLKLPANSATNQFIQIVSDNYLLRTNVANFEGGVRADFIDGKAPSQLLCKSLEIQMESNQVKTIIATGDVNMSQIISDNHSRGLLCEKVTIHRSLETGTITSLIAERNVSLIEKQPDAEKQLVANEVTMNFGKTNQLESLLARQDVKITQGESWATGEKALYLAKEDFEIFEISGQPLARKTEPTSDGSVTGYWIKNADVLRWYPKTGEFSAEGPYVIE